MHSDRAGRTQRSARAFASGARTGLRRVLAPSPCHTASKPGLNLPSRSRSRYRTVTAALRRSSVRLRALGGPVPGEVGRDAGEEDASAPVMDEEQHVQPAQQHRADREEAAGQGAGGLPAQELAPGGRDAPRSGVDAVGPEHLGDRANRHPVPEVEQLTLDALVTPGRVVGGQPHDQRGELVGDRGTAEMAIGVRPAPGNEEPVPAKQRLGPDAECRPPLPWQKPAQHGEPGPVGRLEARPRLLAAQDLELVAQYQDLDLLGTRCTGGPAPRARARDGWRGRRTTTLGNGDDLAGAWRGRTVVGSAGWRELPGQRADRVSDPT